MYPMNFPTSEMGTMPLTGQRSEGQHPTDSYCSLYSSNTHTYRKLHLETKLFDISRRVSITRFIKGMEFLKLSNFLFQTQTHLKYALDSFLEDLGSLASDHITTLGLFLSRLTISIITSLCFCNSSSVNLL